MRQPEAPRMTVDEFLAWAEAQPGDTRYELVDGCPVAMSPASNRHSRVKQRAFMALQAGIDANGRPCEAWVDGPGVKVANEDMFVPDVVVTCGDKVDLDEHVVPNPVIVIEVLSPGTKRTDANQKLKGYFQLASVRHYLIFDPAQTLVVHHMPAEGRIETRIITEGTIDLSPPGISIDIDEIYQDARKGLAE